METQDDKLENSQNAASNEEAELRIDEQIDDDVLSESDKDQYEEPDVNTVNPLLGTTSSHSAAAYCRYLYSA